jgi:hypothetical protein
MVKIYIGFRTLISQSLYFKPKDTFPAFLAELLATALSLTEVNCNNVESTRAWIFFNILKAWGLKSELVEKYPPLGREETHNR